MNETPETAKGVEVETPTSTDVRVRVHFTYRKDLGNLTVCHPDARPKPGEGIKHSALALTAFPKDEDRLVLKRLRKGQCFTVTITGDEYVLKEIEPIEPIEPKTAQGRPKTGYEDLVKLSMRKMEIVRATAEAATEAFGPDWMIDEAHYLTVEDIRAIASGTIIDLAKRGR